MRIFTGIKPDRNRLENITALLKKFKKIDSAFKWVPDENIHLTLRFLGEINENRSHRIIDRLSSLEFKPFNLNIFGCGGFGPGEEIRTLWAGVKNSPELFELFKSSEKILASLGIPRESRTFHPHFTLGRNRSRHTPRAVRELLSKEQDTDLGEFTVTGFQIFRSRLSSSGASYSVLKEIRFDHS